MRKLIALGLVLAVFAGGACGGDDDDGDVAVDETTTTTEAEPEFSTPPFEGDEAEIASAYERFYNSETPDEEAAALMESTEVTEAVLTAAAEASSGGTTSAEVTGIAVQGDIAEVEFTLKTDIVGDIPSKGLAVRQEGEWRVALRTLCTLLSLTGAPPDCERVTSGEVGAQPPA